MSGKKRSVLTKKELKKYGFILAVFAYPAILFMIFYVGININSILLAFQKIDLGGGKTFAGFDNFAFFFESIRNNPIVGTSLKNSLLIYVLNLVICMPLYLIFSFYLFKKFFGNRIFRLIVMVPSIVSTFIICLLFKKFVESALPSIANMLGVKDFPMLLSDPKYTFGTMIFYMIWISFSTSLIVYPNAMDSIDGAIYESVRVEGASLLQEFWYIVMPLIYPTISTFLITGVAGIFTAEGPLISFYMYSAPPEVYTFGYYMTSKVMTASNNLDYPYLAAGGLVITLISAPLTYFVKYLLDKNDPTVA